MAGTQAELEVADPVTAYGFTALPRKVEALLATRRDVKPPIPVRVSDVTLPDTALARAVHAYAREQLASETLSHSMRVYYYGISIARTSFHHLLSPSFEETYLLACLLHDIGTTDANLAATRLSFEFYGGIVVLDLLRREGAPPAQAESVAEAVMRHQDLGDEGTLTAVGALIQLATIFDNVTPPLLEALVHKSTIEDVTTHFPRNSWSACFARTIRKENALKPWAHTTVLGEEAFPAAVLGNRVMGAYD